MSNIDKFITSNLVEELDNVFEELDNKTAEVVSGGQMSTDAVIDLPGGTRIKTEPGDTVELPGNVIVRS